MESPAQPRSPAQQALGVTSNPTACPEHAVLRPSVHPHVACRTGAFLWPFSASFISRNTHLPVPFPYAAVSAVQCASTPATRPRASPLCLFCLGKLNPHHMQTQTSESGPGSRDMWPSWGPQESCRSKHLQVHRAAWHAVAAGIFTSLCHGIPWNSVIRHPCGFT